LKLVQASNRRTELFLVRVLDAVVYPDLPDWLVAGCAVAVCMAVLLVYLRRYRRRTRRGQW
jgi:hypothetical protein